MSSIFSGNSEATENIEDIQQIDDDSLSCIYEFLTTCHKEALHSMIKYALLCYAYCIRMTFLHNVLIFFTDSDPKVVNDLQYDNNTSVRG